MVVNLTSGTATASSAIIDLNFQQTRPIRLNQLDNTTFSFLTNRTASYTQLHCTNHTGITGTNQSFMATQGTFATNDDTSIKFSPTNNFTTILVLTLSPTGYFVVPIQDANTVENVGEDYQDDLAALIEEGTPTPIDVNRMLQDSIRIKKLQNPTLFSYLQTQSYPVFVSSVPILTRASPSQKDTFPTVLNPVSGFTLYRTNYSKDTSPSRGSSGWALMPPLRFVPTSTRSDPPKDKVGEMAFSSLGNLQSMLMLLAMSVLSLIFVSWFGPAFREKLGSKGWVGFAFLSMGLGALFYLLTNAQFAVSSRIALYKASILFVIFGFSMLWDYPFSGVSFWNWLKNYARIQREKQQSLSS